jgi:hypothetical protein
VAKNLSEAGAAEFLAKVGAVESHDAAHFMQSRAHALADAVASRDCARAQLAVAAGYASFGNVAL